MKHNGVSIKAEFVHFRVPAIIQCYRNQRRGKPKDIAPYSRAHHQWTPYTRGGATLCKLFVVDSNGNKMFVGGGKSTCSMSDNFCYRTGRYYALKDAILNYKNLNQRCHIKLQIL
jgi:hypothetical protein